MTSQMQTPVAGGAAGALKSSSFRGADELEIPQTAPQSKVRLQFLARRLHRLGEVPLFHFLDEVERGADLRSHLETYAELPGDFIWANGGNQFPVPFAIDGGRSP
jgi:hypothetical protein